MIAMAIRSRRLGLLAGLVLSAVFATSGHAAPPFSAAVSGYSIGGCNFLSFPVYWPSVEWVVPGTPQTRPTWTDDIQTIESADGQTVLALVRTDSRGLRIDRLLLDITPNNNTRVPFFNGLPEYYGARLAVAKNGRVFAAVTMPDGASAGPRIAVISSDGSLDHVISINGSINNMAVAADDCTIFYADGNTIRRVNACTGVPLPAFATSGQAFTDLAVLSNGDVLATTGQSLQLLSPAGVVRTFAIQRDGKHLIDALGVSSDESIVVVADMGYCDNGGQLIALSVADGHELWRQETQYISTATGVVVGTLPSAIPALSAVTLMVLAATLALLAGSVLRH